jgi:hypothetical protein
MPIDLSTIAILASLFLGAVVGNAVWFGDPLQVQFAVPAKLVEQGFTEATAEQLFVSEAARVSQVVSAVHTPEVHARSNPSVVAAVAKPLGLDNLVVALQGQLGLHLVFVQGAVLSNATGGALDMVIFVTEPLEPVVRLELTQADGSPTALVRRGSQLVLEHVSPYRVALTDFSEGIAGDAPALARAKDLATRALARHWVPGRATERVMLHNLLGITALLDGDMAAAEAQFRLTDAIPDVLPAARGTVALNRAFVAVAQRRPAQAVAYFKAGLALSAGVDLAGYQARIAMLGGLVAWSAGDMDKAEAWLRKAIADLPDDAAPHVYLAQLLEAKGEAAGAAAERAVAADVRRFGVDILAIAQSEFWVDPVQGGIKRRD